MTITAKGKKIIIGCIAGVLLVALIIGIVIGSLLIYYNSDDIVMGEEANMMMRYNKSAMKMGLYQKNTRASKENDIWQQNTLPIGNGMLGGSIYGEVFNERIIFNEKTLWTGGPSPKRPDYNGGNLIEPDKNGKTVGDYYKEVQKLFAEGKDREASKLCDKLVGISDGYGAYQCWGEIDIHMHHNFKKTDSYERYLSVEEAVAGVKYSKGESEFTREYFASYPYNVLAIKLTANDNEKLNMDISFPSAQKGESVAEGKTIRTYGKIEDNDLQYYSRMDIVTGGKVQVSSKGVLTVSDANQAVLIISAGTDYANVYPTYRTNESAEELAGRVNLKVENAVARGYDKLKEEHIADYKSLYDKMSLNLGGAEPDMTTDQLLKQYNSGFLKSSQRRYLEQLLYNYGRYLMIASSRATDVLPSNLQGLWNNQNQPPWSSDYHMNVNLQMNYWPAYNTNLAECAIPLINYVDSLRKPGRITAGVYAGITSGEDEQNGFVFHTQNTPFGWTCPGWEFSWGWSPAATAWILQNVYEYYEYTGDVDYLRDKVYPMLREASLYFKKVLIEDKETGRLVTAPTYSPEHGPRTMGNTYEQSLIWQLFTDTVTAAKILQVDNALASELNAKIEKLNPIEIGQDGQIKEWYHETKLNKIGEHHHRHMSHLLGLFPGDLINKETHPEWLDAAVVSLNNRSDKSTGWAMGQRINTWARVGDGDRSFKLIKQLFKHGIYANMWDGHPPFQIDGNFGYTAGVTEMLMQSNLGHIELLPALPSDWKQGKVSGIVARGNFEISMQWNESKLTTLSVISHNGGRCIMDIGTTDIRIVDENGNAVPYIVLGDKIAFDTAREMNYKLL